MKTSLLALLTLVPTLAFGAGSCQIVPSDDNDANHLRFDFYQADRRVTRYDSLDEALGVMSDLEGQGICERAMTIAPRCVLSTWGNSLYIDQGPAALKEKGKPVGVFNDADKALDLLAKLERNKICARGEVPDSVCTIGADNSQSMYYVVQDDGTHRPPAYFKSVTSAIQWRDGLAKGLGCRAEPQALECRIVSRKTSILRRDRFDVYLGPKNFVTYDNLDTATAARDALLKSKACIQSTKVSGIDMVEEPAGAEATAI